MDYSKQFETATGSLSVERVREGSPVEVCVTDIERWGSADLTNDGAFEAALALVEATGVESATHYDVLTAEQAEQTAAYWLETAVEMRREEVEKKSKRQEEVRQFMSDVLGYSVAVPNEKDFEKYDKAVAWAENRAKPKKSPSVLLGVCDAEFADKDTVWYSEGNDFREKRQPVKFRFNKGKGKWEWWTEDHGWNTYVGEHLGCLSTTYFPMTELVDG